MKPRDRLWPPHMDILRPVQSNCTVLFRCHGARPVRFCAFVMYKYWRSVPAPPPSTRPASSTWFRVIPPVTALYAHFAARVFFNTLEPWAKWYRSLCAPNTSPPWNCFTFLWSSCSQIENCTERYNSQLQPVYSTCTNESVSNEYVYIYIYI